MTFEDEAKIMKHHLCLPLIAPCNLCALHKGVVELRGEIQKLKAENEKLFNPGWAHPDLAIRLHDESQKLMAENKRLKYDLELAVAHDRQPYPTAEAYELACKTREKYRVENQKLREALEFSQTAIDHAIALEYVGEGSTLGMFKEASERAQKAMAQDDEMGGRT